MSAVTNSSRSLHDVSRLPTGAVTDELLPLYRRMAARLALLFCLVGVAMLPFDLAGSQWLHGEQLPGDVRKIVTVTEVFGHGAGVAFILITLATLVPGGWRLTILPAATAFGAGLLVNLIKLSVARVRPHAFDSPHILDSFQGWFPWWTMNQQASTMGHAWQSFPSGHTATAVGLAWGLSYYFPRGQWLFASFAGLAAIQRVQSGAHYLSDVFAGAAVACVWAIVCLHPRMFGGKLLVAPSRPRPSDVPETA